MPDRGRSDSLETRLVGAKKSVCYNPHLPSACVERGGDVEGPGGVQQEDGRLVQGQVPDGCVLVWLVGVPIVRLSACSSPSPSNC